MYLQEVMIIYAEEFFLAMCKLKFYAYRIAWLYPIRKICEHFVHEKNTCYTVVMPWWLSTQERTGHY